MSAYLESYLETLTGPIELVGHFWLNLELL